MCWVDMEAAPEFVCSSPGVGLAIAVYWEPRRGLEGGDVHVSVFVGVGVPYLTAHLKLSARHSVACHPNEMKRHQKLQGRSQAVHKLV